MSSGKASHELMAKRMGCMPQTGLGLFSLPLPGSSKSEYSGEIEHRQRVELTVLLSIQLPCWCAAIGRRVAEAA